MKLYVLTTWRRDFEGANVPDLVSDMFQWAIAHKEHLPNTPQCYGRCEDVTGQKGPSIYPGRVFIVLLEVSENVWDHFSNDPRIHLLGKCDDDAPMSIEERAGLTKWLLANNCEVPNISEMVTKTEVRRRLKLVL